MQASMNSARVSSAATVDPGRSLNAFKWHSAVSRISRAAVSAICFVLCALLLYQYQAPEPIKTMANKPLVTSVTSLVVGIFIAPQQQQQHRSSRQPEQRWDQ